MHSGKNTMEHNEFPLDFRWFVEKSYHQTQHIYVVYQKVNHCNDVYLNLEFEYSLTKYPLSVPLLITRYWYLFLPFLLKDESFIRDASRDFNIECGIVVYSVEKPSTVVIETLHYN